MSDDFRVYSTSIWLWSIHPSIHPCILPSFLPSFLPSTCLAIHPLLTMEIFLSIGHSKKDWSMIWVANTCSSPNLQKLHLMSWHWLLRRHPWAAIAFKQGRAGLLNLFVAHKQLCDWLWLCLRMSLHHWACPDILNFRFCPSHFQAWCLAGAALQAELAPNLPTAPGPRTALLWVEATPTLLPVQPVASGVWSECRGGKHMVGNILHHLPQESSTRFWTSHEKSHELCCKRPCEMFLPASRGEREALMPVNSSPNAGYTNQEILVQQVGFCQSGWARGKFYVLPRVARPQTATLQQQAATATRNASNERLLESMANGKLWFTESMVYNSCGGGPRHCQVPWFWNSKAPHHSCIGHDFVDDPFVQPDYWGSWSPIHLANSCMHFPSAVPAKYHESDREPMVVRLMPETIHSKSSKAAPLTHFLLYILYICSSNNQVDQSPSSHHGTLELSHQQIFAVEHRKPERAPALPDRWVCTHSKA